MGSDIIKVKKKKFSFPISEPLEKAIDNFVNAHNSGDLCEDCYEAELYNDINNSLHIEITDEQAEELRDYYLRGGMYEND